MAATLVHGRRKKEKKICAFAMYYLVPLVQNKNYITIFGFSEKMLCTSDVECCTDFSCYGLWSSKCFLDSGLKTFIVYFAYYSTYY